MKPDLVRTDSRSPIGVRAASLIAALALSVLTACGGGGGQASTAEPVPSTGTREQTGRALDLAIDGDGLFALEGEHGAQRYSRYGRFDVDRDGSLVHASGARPIGRAAGADASSPAQALPRIARTMTPSASTRVAAEINLDSRTATYAPWGAWADPFDPLDSSTYQCATTRVLHDREGQAASTVLYFRHASSLSWQVYVTLNRVPLPEPVATLAFDYAGRLAGRPEWAVDLPAVPTEDGRGSTMPIPGFVFDFSDATGYASYFSVSELTDDGWGEGQLSGVGVASDGRVTLGYDNGQQRDAGRLLLAKFSVADRLVRRDDDTWSCERDCRGPLLAAPGTGLVGALIAGVLETASH